MLQDAIVRGDYEYALQLLDEGDRPENHFLPQKNRDIARDPVVCQLVWNKDRDKPSLVLDFVLTMANRCPFKSSADYAIPDMGYYGANALTMAINARAPLHFISKLCEKALSEDPHFMERCDGAGRTALCMAAELGNQALTETLLNAGAKADALDGRGRHAVILAAQANNVDALISLLKHSKISCSPGCQDADEWVKPFIERLDADGLAQVVAAVPKEAGNVAGSIASVLLKSAHESEEHFCRLIGVFASLLTNLELRDLAKNPMCGSVKILEALFDAIDAQYLQEHISDMRKAVFDERCMSTLKRPYDLFASRDLRLQELLAKSSWSEVELVEMTDELLFAIGCESVKLTEMLVKKLVEAGRSPITTLSPGWSEKLIAVLAAHNPAGLHEYFPDDELDMLYFRYPRDMQFTNGASLEVFLQSRLKELRFMASRTIQDLLRQAVRLGSQPAVRLLVAAVPDCLSLTHEMSLLLDLPMNLALKSAIQARSNEMVALLMELGAIPDWDDARLSDAMAQSSSTSGTDDDNTDDDNTDGDTGNDDTVDDNL